MSPLRIYGSTSGYTEIAPNSVASNNTLTLPSTGSSLVSQDANGNITISGILTATSFSGDGSGLTGVGVGASDSINTTGIITASGFVGNLTGTATGLSGTPNIVLGIATVSAGTTSAPSITPTGDSNTGVFFPSADTIALSSGGSERIRVDSSGNINIDSGTVYVDATNNRFAVGTTSPNCHLDVRDNVGGSARLDIHSQGSGGVLSTFTAERNGGLRISSESSAGWLAFNTGTSGTAERLRISSNGAISATMSNATDTANALLTLNRAYGVHPGKQTDLYGLYASIQSGGANTDNCAAVFGLSNVELAPGVTGKSGATYTTGIGVMGWSVGNTDGYGTSVGLYARLQQTGATNGGLIGLLIDLPNYSGGTSGVTYRSAYTGSATQTVLSVQRNNSTIGSITTTQTATAYNTSSDYRLKENIAPLTGAIPRLLQIPVHRFNFINAPETTVDGFIAHEVAPYVPEAVTGKKDEMREVAVLDVDEKPIFDENNNPITKLEPVYQGIDQSKLVPLLTAALQEAVSEIKALKERVSVLESQ